MLQSSPLRYSSATTVVEAPFRVRKGPICPLHLSATDLDNRGKEKKLVNGNATHQKKGVRRYKGNLEEGKLVSSTF
ncbi:hypothetical protein COLO4_35636 [Corchorus olitorius]|uniref:Uncharacterized protein n=1 Tax=Corchorus olitorius TaxID=93759 RepID=A0A1R3GEE8_9ROSI|nr:hypothetical protein COLO4_35636 [Corchorus olitorius]